MSVLVLVAIVLHSVVVFSGARYLFARRYVHDAHAHFAAAIAASASFFVIMHLVHLRAGAAPNVLWYAFSIFNAQLYQSLIFWFRKTSSQHFPSGQKPPTTLTARIL